MKKLIAIILTLILTLTLAACDNDRVSQEEYDRLLEERDQLLQGEKSESNTTPDISTNVIPDVTSATSSPSGFQEWDEYYFPVTDDHIEIIRESRIHSDWRSDDEYFLYYATSYTLISYDNDGKAVDARTKYICPTEQDATDFPRNNFEELHQNGNIIYLYHIKSSIDDSRIKNDQIDFLVEEGTEFYASKP